MAAAIIGVIGVGQQVPFAGNNKKIYIKYVRFFFSACAASCLVPASDRLTGAFDASLLHDVSVVVVVNISTSD